MKDENFTRLVKELQRKIDYEEEKTYSKTVINEYRNPNHFGILENPDATAKIKGSCGDTMKFSLKINNGIIKKVNFWTDGCGATIAAGNKLCKIILGKKIREAHKINNEKLIDALDGLPKEHNHCALLAVETFHKTIKNYIKLKKINGENLQ